MSTVIGAYAIPVLSHMGLLLASIAAEAWFETLDEKGDE